MVRFSRIFGYAFKKVTKMGFFKAGVLCCICFTLILLYLRHTSSPEIKSLKNKFQMGDVTEYCNSPHTVEGKENENIEGYTLTQLQMFIRHGDRSPIHAKAIPHISPVRISCLFDDNDSILAEHRDKLEAYRTIIQRNIFKVTGTNKTALFDVRSFCKPGQLTPYGYLQHLYNGIHLRSSYNTFLSQLKLNTEVLIQSTDVPRTIQSSVLLFSGLFLEELSIDEDIELFVNVIPDESSAHMLVDENNEVIKCHGLRAISDVRKTQEFMDFRKNVKNLEHNLADILLVKRDSLPVFNRIFDIFYTKLCHHQDVPAGPRSYIPQSLVKQFLLFSHIYGRAIHSSVMQYQTLSLFSQVASHALNTITNEDEHKRLVIYSGHDSMITPLLMMLSLHEVNNVKWPPYASKLIFEIFQDNNFHEKMSLKEKVEATYFRVFYNGVLMKRVKFCKKQNTKNGLCSLTNLFTEVSDGMFTGMLPAQINSMEPETLNKALFTKIKRICQIK